MSGITAWATWTSGGVRAGADPSTPAAPPLRVSGAEGRVEPSGAAAARASGPLGVWAEAPALSKIHPRARRPHVSAKQLVQLASVVLGDRRPEGLGLVLGSASGCAAPDREFQHELDTKGWGFGSPSLFVYTLPTAALGEVSIAMAATGPLLTVSAGSASGLESIVRAHEWVAAGRCEQVLCGSYELGVAHEHIALFLVERDARRSLAGTTGFGELPPAGAAGDALSLAAALTGSGATSITSRDPQGFWATVALGAAT
jgi:hypothetical protein